MNRHRPAAMRSARVTHGRPPELHDRDCDQPGWMVDQPIRGGLGVFARCRRCGAVQHRPVTDPAAA